MSDESNRIGGRTGANANLVSILGDLVSSDGIQAIRVPLGTPGQVLSVDLAAESGLAWVDPGASTALTFSDGLTKDGADNVTNDLVTGATVAQVAINVVGGDVDITTAGAQDINLTSGRDIIFDVSRRFEVTADGATGISLNASTGPLALGSTGNIDITASAGIISLQAGIQLALASNGGHMLMNSSNSILLTAANTVGFTSAAKWSVETTGATADIQMDAGQAIRFNTVNTTKPIRFFGGAGAAQQPVANPAGGGVIDTECRTQLIALLDAMRAWGLC